jgi:error-prone DNA polymerase
MSYIELHARSAFSFLEGASLPEELAGVCAHFGMPAMALLDTDGVYGAPRFHLAAKKAGFKAHIGAEVSFSSRSHGSVEKTHQPSKINNQQLKNSSATQCLRSEFRLPLLVSTRAGYQNLCRLITKMKLRAKKGEGAACEQELQEHAEGLICLTGGAEGPLAAALKHGGLEEAQQCVDQLAGIFGPGNVYVELQRHFQREDE